MAKLTKRTKAIALKAADSAQKVLKYFEKKYPSDKRPRNALKVLRKWARTGVFHMKVIRKASLDAHAAARKCPEDSAARFAARACGQAVAVAHVTTHSLGVKYYIKKVKKAIKAAKKV